MEAGLCQKLFRAFPLLYGQAGKPDSLRFGVECDDGWFDLIWELSNQIELLNQEQVKRGESATMAVQIKEKFGMLRFYCDRASPEISALIGAAETKSAHICETCGSPGEAYRSTSWYYTRCANHATNHRGEPLIKRSSSV